MLFFGRITQTLTQKVSVGRYILSWQDGQIYIAIPNGQEGKPAWQPIQAASFGTNAEQDYFFDLDHDQLYQNTVVNSVRNSWQESKFSGFTDNGIKLFYLQDGKIISEVPLITKQLDRSFSVQDVSSITVIPTTTSFQNIIVDRRSQLTVEPVLGETNINGAVLNSLSAILPHLNPVLTYSWYQDMIKYITNSSIISTGNAVLIPPMVKISAYNSDKKSVLERSASGLISKIYQENIVLAQSDNSWITYGGLKPDYSGSLYSPRQGPVKVTLKGFVTSENVKEKKLKIQFTALINGGPEKYQFDLTESGVSVSLTFPLIFADYIQFQAEILHVGQECREARFYGIEITLV